MRILKVEPSKKTTKKASEKTAKYPDRGRRKSFPGDRFGGQCVLLYCSRRGKAEQDNTKPMAGNRQYLQPFFPLGEMTTLAIPYLSLTSR